MMASNVTAEAAEAAETAETAEAADVAANIYQKIGSTEKRNIPGRSRKSRNGAATKIIGGERQKNRNSSRYVTILFLPIPYSTRQQRSDVKDLTARFSLLVLQFCLVYYKEVKWLNKPT